MEKTITLEDLKKDDFDLSTVKISTEYMPLEEKIKYAEEIVEHSVATNQYGYIRVNHVFYEMVRLLYKIRLYTNIDLDLSDFSIETYDLMKKKRIDEIIDWNTDDLCTDVFEFDDVVDNVMLDKKQENKLENIMAKASENFFGLLLDMGEHVNGMLDKGDPNKIAKYLSKGVEMMAKKMPDFSQFDVQHYLESIKGDKEEKVDSNEIN